MRITELSSERASVLTREFSQGFPADCGIEPVELDLGRAVSELRPNRRHSQQDGFVHAGVLATMADHTAGYAGFTLIEADQRILTLEFKINFLRPARGELLRCRAQVLRRGRNVLVADSEVHVLTGDEEKLVAKALVTLMAVPASKVAGGDRS